MIIRQQTCLHRLKSPRVDCTLLFLLFMIFASSGIQAETIPLPVRGTSVSLQQQASLLPATVETQAQTFETMLMQQQSFQPWNDQWLTSAPPMWVKLTLQNPSQGNSEWVLRVKRRFFEQLEVYIPNPDTDGYIQYSSGIQNYQPSDVMAQDFVYPIIFPSGQNADIFIKVETIQETLGPLDIAIQDLLTYEESRVTNMWALGLYFGAIIALVFYNLVLYLNLRTPGHRMYVAAMTAVLGFMAMDAGLLQSLLPPILSNREPAVFATLNFLMTGAMIRFCQVFCQIQRVNRHLDVWMWLLFWGLLAAAAVTLFAPLTMTTVLALVGQVFITLVVVTLLVASTMAGVKGNSAGYIFLAAWLAFLLGGMLRTLLTLEMLPRMPITEYAVYIGSVLEAMILALGLSYRVGQLRLQRNKAVREQHQAMTLANKDDLTPAYNRRFFDNYLAQILTGSNTDRSRTALLLLDIDHFKNINDNYGHDAGDVMLKAITERCIHAMREGDVLCRLGGDEFAIVLNDVDEATAINHAKRIQQRIEGNPIQYANQEIAITMSVGVMTSLSSVHTVSDALRHADQALYQAKAAGRNQVVVYS